MKLESTSLESEGVATDSVVLVVYEFLVTF